MTIVSNSYTNIFGGNVVQTAPISFEQLTLSTSDTILSWPIQFQDTEDVTAQIMGVDSPTTDDWNLILPNATFVSVGTTLLIFNNGAHSFNVLDNAESTIAAMLPSSFFYFILTDNTTIGGTWVISPFGQGTLAVTSVAATAPASGFTITGSPITNSGTFVFTLDDDLLALEDLSTTGLAVRTAPSTWTTRQLTSGNANLAITNAGGIGGNPLLTLSSDIINLTTLHSTAVYTNLIINDTVGDISITPTGVGNINLRDIVIDSLDNVSGINDLSVGGIITSPQVMSANAYVSVTGVTPTIVKSYNVSSITRVSAGIYRVNFINTIENPISIASPVWNLGGSPTFLFGTTISNSTNGYVEVTTYRATGGILATPTDNSFTVMVA